MSMLSEFRAFIARGNVVDLAVGVIIGAAFGKIVTSLVNDLVMPPVGLIIGGMDFSELKIPIRAADPAHKLAGVSINYGVFVTTIIQFLIIAWVIFLVVKGVNALQRKQAEAPPAPTTSEVLLTEIRDLLAAPNTAERR
ncbi:MAG TPA: large-conductance mechanosensitive channel protein MscL [Caulobacteraceae bacterium]|jgi:large conductance mechanosensitive channel|nr:large-conductance mechanosensitive channel protein MscL [Caulobacteraceae bacterium]